jgi:hypothetical protein
MGFEEGGDPSAVAVQAPPVAAVPEAPTGSAVTLPQDSGSGGDGGTGVGAPDLDGKASEDESTSSKIELPELDANLKKPDGNQNQFAENPETDQDHLYYNLPINLDDANLSFIDNLPQARVPKADLLKKQNDSGPESIREKIDFDRKRDRWYYMGGSELVIAYLESRLDNPALTYNDFLKTDAAKRVQAEMYSEENKQGKVLGGDELLTNEAKILIAELKRFRKNLQQDRALLGDKIKAVEGVVAQLQSSPQGEDDLNVQQQLAEAQQQVEQLNNEQKELDAAIEANTQAIQAEQDKLAQNKQEKGEVEPEKKAKEAIILLTEYRKNISAYENMISYYEQQLSVANPVEAENIRQAIETLKEEFRKTREEKFGKLIEVAAQDIYRPALAETFKTDPFGAEMRLVFAMANGRVFKPSEVRQETLAELNKVLFGEITTIILGKYNEISKAEDGKELTTQELLQLPTQEALSRILKKQGYSEADALAQIQTLVNNLNEQGLGVEKDDVLKVILEATIEGKRADVEVEKNISLFGRISEIIFEKKNAFVNQTREQLVGSIKKSVSELIQLTPFSSLAKVIEQQIERIDLDVFLEFLLTGHSFDRQFRELGYKTEEELREKGVTPLTPTDVEKFISKEKSPEEGVKHLLLKGMEGIIPDGQLKILEELSGNDFFSSKELESFIQTSSSKENHAKFSEKLIAILTEKDESQVHELNIQLTSECFAYITALPRLYKEGKPKTGSLGVKT